MVFANMLRLGRARVGNVELVHPRIGDGKTESICVRRPLALCFHLAGKRIAPSTTSRLACPHRQTNMEPTPFASEQLRGTTCWCLGHRFRQEALLHCKTVRKAPGHIVFRKLAALSHNPNLAEHMVIACLPGVAQLLDGFHSETLRFSMGAILETLK